MIDDQPLPPVDPASIAHIEVHPVLVEEAQDDPELLTKLTRGQLVIVQDRMVRKVITDPNATIGQMAAVHERLSKNARLVAEGDTNAKQAPVVQINIIREGAPEKTVTIVGAAEPITQPDSLPKEAA